MKIVAWNCHGLGNHKAVRGILDVQRRENPDVLFLSETKLDEKRMKKICWLLDMPNMAIHSSNGKSGGLALFWDESMYVSIQDVNERWIDVFVRVAPRNLFGK